MKKEDIKMMEKILDSGNIGFAYHYPSDGSGCQEKVIALTPENVANYLGSHWADAEKIVITDVLDRLILNTIGGLIDQCPKQELHAEITSLLAPIQKGEKEAGEVLQIDRNIADTYYALEDQGLVWWGMV